MAGRQPPAPARADPLAAPRTRLLRRCRGRGGRWERRWPGGPGPLGGRRGCGGPLALPPQAVRRAEADDPREGCAKIGRAPRVPSYGPAGSQCCLRAPSAFGRGFRGNLKKKHFEVALRPRWTNVRLPVARQSDNPRFRRTDAILLGGRLSSSVSAEEIVAGVPSSVFFFFF